MIQTVHYLFAAIDVQYRANREAEFLLVYCLGNGQMKGVPLRETFLFMRWDGIVYQCLDADTCQVFLKFVPIG